MQCSAVAGGHGPCAAGAGWLARAHADTPCPALPRPALPCHPPASPSTAGVHAARRPAVCQWGPAHWARAEQDPQGHHQPIPAAAGGCWERHRYPRQARQGMALHMRGNMGVPPMPNACRAPAPAPPQGRKAKFVPGWDCHGLPIELKVLQSMKESERRGLTPLQLRQKAAEFALKTVDAQREQFRRCVWRLGRSDRGGWLGRGRLREAGLPGWRLLRVQRSGAGRQCRVPSLPHPAAPPPAAGTACGRTGTRRTSRWSRRMRRHSCVCLDRWCSTATSTGAGVLGSGAGSGGRPERRPEWGRPGAQALEVEAPLCPVWGQGAAATLLRPARPRAPQRPQAGALEPVEPHGACGG